MTTRSWTLPAAAGLAAAEAAALIVALGVRDVNGRVLYMLFVAAKFPFCALVVRVRPGAYLGLMLWEIGAVVTALAARGAPISLRLLEVAVAGGVIALLVASTPLFPSVRLPESRQT